MGGCSLTYGIARGLVTEHKEKMQQLLEWQVAHFGDHFSKCLSAVYVYRELNSSVRKKVRNLRAETLGRIAFYALDNLISVHSRRWIDGNGISSGRELLREIAVTAIVAEMTRIFNDSLNKSTQK